MLRVIIVDDEPLARKGLREMLYDLDGVEVAAEAESAEQAAHLIASENPDAIFLDIQMPRKNGFDLVNNMPQPQVPVVFVTAHTEHAVRAFDVQAVDYLLKPVRPERLSLAIERVRSVVSDTDEPLVESKEETVCFRTPERTLVSPLSEVVLLQAEKDFTRITVSAESPLLICQSLGSYEKILPNPPFLRIDRSNLINLDRLHSLEISPTRGANLIMSGLEEPFPVGRAALKRLRLALPQHFKDIG